VTKLCGTEKRLVSPIKLSTVIIMEQTYPVGGAITYWSQSNWSSRAVLAKGLDALGFGVFAPNKRTPSAALKTALQDVFREHFWIIRPMSRSGTFSVIKEETKTYPEANVYTVVYTVRVDENMEARMCPYDMGLSSKITEELRKHEDLVTSVQVSDTLTSILRDLRSVRLRPNGGLYWLSKEKLGTWQNVAEVVESAGYPQKNKVYYLRNVIDSDGVRAICDALCEEVAGETQRLDKEINSVDMALGTSALESRKKMCTEMRRKIRQYEQILGKSLDDLTSSVMTVEMAAASAALILAATP
jgi:hypothetical protein